MGYHQPRRRLKESRGVGAIEIVWIVLVVVAIAALVAFIIVEAGGGALMT